jgi:hypothetical protein
MFTVALKQWTQLHYNTYLCLYFVCGEGGRGATEWGVGKETEKSLTYHEYGSEDIKLKQTQALICVFSKTTKLILLDSNTKIQKTYIILGFHLKYSVK